MDDDKDLIQKPIEPKRVDSMKQLPKGFSAVILPDGRRTFALNDKDANYDELCLLLGTLKIIDKRLTDHLNSIQPTSEVRYG